jgi:flagellar protein FlgJ
MRADTQSWQVYTNLKGLQELKTVAHTDQKAALREVAKQFEALFLEMVFKQARKVNFDDEGMLTSDRVKFFQDWQDKQLAQDIAAKGSMGLADQLVEQLSPKHPTLTTAEYEQLKQEHKLPTTQDVLHLRHRPEKD